MGTDETLASRIITDIRRLDLDRLRQQVEDGIMAGSDKLHIKPVQPEPLKLD
jgi:CPA2 family monovalent cation:H+ antiporter-2